MQTISPERAALLVIDMQVGLFEHPIYRGEALLERLCALAERAEAAGAPVYYIQHANKTQLVEGSPQFQLHPRLQPQPGDGAVVKRHGSALQDTPLEADLRRRGVTTLVVAGLVTHGCVKATALDALERGFQVVLVEDGHSSYSADAGKKIVEWNEKLTLAGAALRPAEDLFR